MSRTIIIGDIHGCFDELCDLHELINLKADDRVIAVGDLITKGPKSAQVLDLFINDQRFSSVVGNHDRRIRQHLRGEAVPLTKQQREAIQQLDDNRGRYSEFLRSLPYLIELPEEFDQAQLAIENSLLRRRGQYQLGLRGFGGFEPFF